MFIAILRDFHYGEVARKEVRTIKEGRKWAETQQPGLCHIETTRGTLMGYHGYSRKYQKWHVLPI